MTRQRDHAFQQRDDAFAIARGDTAAMLEQHQRAENAEAQVDAITRERDEAYAAVRAGNAGMETMERDLYLRMQAVEAERDALIKEKDALVEYLKARTLERDEQRAYAEMWRERTIAAALDETKLAAERDAWQERDELEYVRKDRDALRERIRTATTALTGGAQFATLAFDRDHWKDQRDIEYDLAREAEQGLIAMRALRDSWRARAETAEARAKEAEARANAAGSADERIVLDIDGPK